MVPFLRNWPDYKPLMKEVLMPQEIMPEIVCPFFQSPSQFQLGDIRPQLTLDGSRKYGIKAPSYPLHSILHPVLETARWSLSPFNLRPRRKAR